VAVERSPQAGVAASEVAVIDRRTGAELYTAPISGIVDFDVQSDGKLAMLTRPARAGSRPGCKPSSLTWYSPADPQAHPVAGSFCSGEVRFARNRAVVRVRRSDHAVALSAVTLTGQTTQIANLGPGLNLGVGEFDSDGTRVAYGQRTCLGPRLFLADLDSPGAPDSEAPACALEASSDAVRLGARRARVGIRCPEGCRARLALEIPAGHYGSRRFGRDQRIARGLLTLPLQGERDVSLRLSARRRGQLRALGASRLLLVAMVAGRDDVTRRVQLDLRVASPR
jgi:hypothetical protein